MELVVLITLAVSLILYFSFTIVILVLALKKPDNKFVTANKLVWVLLILLLPLLGPILYLAMERKK